MSVSLIDFVILVSNLSGKDRCQDLEGNVEAVKIAYIIGQGDGTLDVDGLVWEDLRGNVILL